MTDSRLLPRVLAAWKQAFGNGTEEQEDDRTFSRPPDSLQQCPLCGASVDRLHVHLGTPEGEGCPKTPIERDVPSP